MRAWVILDDHYHLLLKTRVGKDLSHFFGRLHGATSRQLNLWDNAMGRQVWHNYWDTCIRTEASLWGHFNYTPNNPVKHGYVTHPKDWEFSSYGYYLRERGEQWLADCWMQYPVIDHIEIVVFKEAFNRYHFLSITTAMMTVVLFTIGQAKGD